MNFAHTKPASATQLAILIAVTIILILCIARLFGAFCKHEKFASKQAHVIHDSARQIFEANGGDATYSQYKNTVPGADPVQYSDVRGLFRAGKMTPTAVENVM